MELPKITYRDPVELRLHPLQKALPDPDKASPEWHAFVDGLAAAGPEAIPPLICTREGMVMDGGRRWRAAKQLQWTQVPCIERPEHEAGWLILSSLFGQRSWNKGAKAYVAIGLLPDWAKSAELRRLENLRRGGKNTQKPLIFPKHSDCASSPETLAEICARLGASTTTMDLAVRVHDLLHNPDCKRLRSIFEREEEKMPNAEQLRALQKELRDEFEPQLFDSERKVSLWSIEAGITSRIRTSGQARTDQLNFFGSLFSKFKHRAQAWDTMPKGEQKLLLQHWRSTVAVMPPELRNEMLTVLQEDES